MTLSEALELVLDMASDNAISEADAERYGHPDEYQRQRQALEIVGRLYAEEAKEEEKQTATAGFAD